MFAKICIKCLCQNQCRDNKFVLKALHSLFFGFMNVSETYIKTFFQSVFYCIMSLLSLENPNALVNQH